MRGLRFILLSITFLILEALCFVELLTDLIGEPFWRIIRFCSLYERTPKKFKEQALYCAQHYKSATLNHWGYVKMRFRECMEGVKNRE